MRGQAPRLKTSTLFRLLFKAPSLEGFMEQNEEGLKLPSFREYIVELCKEQGQVPGHIIKRANIERSFGHQLFRGDRKPSRDTVLQLAFGFEADVDLAQELLKHAGMGALYPRVKRDSAIIYCLHHRFTIMDAQRVLHEMDLPLMGGGEIR